MRRGVVLTICFAALLVVGLAADTPFPEGPGPTFEFATVRWMGDKTTIIWPDGATRKVIAFAGKRKPEGLDERNWYLTGAMNLMGKKGFDLVQYTSDDVVMKWEVGK